MRTSGVIPGVLLGVLLLPAIPLQTQYAPRSACMRHPEAAIGYVDSCANFWFTAFDQHYALVGPAALFEATRKALLVR